jgi:hypothetical protein
MLRLCVFYATIGSVSQSGLRSEPGIRACCAGVTMPASVRIADESSLREVRAMSDEVVAETFVSFAARWEPFGGADDEDIFVAFGISSAEYRRRLWWALNLPDGPYLDDLLRQRLLDYARAYDAPSKPAIGQ